MYGKVSARAAQMMDEPEVEDFFIRLVQRVVPKSYAQAKAEVVVTKQFLYNFSGDQPRFLARSFGNPGDHNGQMSNGYRWPYGPVAIITPFNFPVEISVLQLMGALFMGNKPVLKVDNKVAIAAEQFIRMLHAAGMPMSDVDFICSDGPVMNELLLRSQPRNTLFTGSQKVAEKLALDLHGKVCLEDAGFDWKILGPDVGDVDYVAWQSDHDAYATIGQKCSAQSILFMHQNWVDAGLEGKLSKLASQRKVSDLTAGPVLTWTTKQILQHVKDVLTIPGSRVAFGGKPLGKLLFL
jgi:1-pyrroline-5-carboxylate dehydrogenase